MLGKTEVLVFLIFVNAFFIILLFFLKKFKRRMEKFIVKIPKNLKVSYKSPKIDKRIVIDVGPIIYKPYGVGVYTRSLLEAIYKLNNNKNEYILFSCSWKYKPPRWCTKIAKTSDRYGIYHIKFPVKAFNLLIGHFNFPRMEEFISNIDILFSPHPLPLPITDAKRVITIYDLNYLDNPEFKTDDIYEKASIKKATLANHIITISEFSKERIIRLLGIDSQKISVIYGAPDNEFKIIQDELRIEKVVSKYKTNPSFIMYAGTSVKRKNLITLFKAFSIIRSKKNTKKLKLVLLGVTLKEALRLINGNNIKNIDDGIIALGYVDRKEIATIYNAAKLLVYPSLYEGFGLPILESMACGVPVVTTKLTAIPEIAGDAAFFVENPCDYKELSESIIKLLSNKKLWNIYKEKGLNRVKDFSWEESAEKLIKIFDRL